MTGHANKPGAGRPDTVITQAMRTAVAVMAAVRMPLYLQRVKLAAITNTKQMSAKTFGKHFKKELRDGDEILVSTVGMKMAMTAMSNHKDHVQAGKYILQTRGARVDPKWKEPDQKISGTLGAGGGSRSVTFTLDIGSHGPAAAAVSCSASGPGGGERVED